MQKNLLRNQLAKQEIKQKQLRLDFVHQRRNSNLRHWNDDVRTKNSRSKSRINEESPNKKPASQRQRLGIQNKYDSKKAQ